MVQVGQSRIRSGCAFCRVPTKTCFDIEDEPTQDATYLLGMWIRQAGWEGRFEYTLAERASWLQHTRDYNQDD